MLRFDSIFVSSFWFGKLDLRLNKMRWALPSYYSLMLSFSNIFQILQSFHSPSHGNQLNFMWKIYHPYQSHFLSISHILQKSSPNSHGHKSWLSQIISKWLLSKLKVILPLPHTYFTYQHLPNSTGSFESSLTLTISSLIINNPKLIPSLHGYPNCYVLRYESLHTLDKGAKDNWHLCKNLWFIMLDEKHMELESVIFVILVKLKDLMKTRLAQIEVFLGLKR